MDEKYQFLSDLQEKLSKSLTVRVIEETDHLRYIEYSNGKKGAAAKTNPDGLLQLTCAVSDHKYDNYHHYKLADGCTHMVIEK